MTREELLQSARNLQQPYTRATEEFAKKHELIASELFKRMDSRTDIDRLIGTNNREMMKNNSYNFLRFMNSLFHSYKPEVLVDTVLWVFRTYRSHGFQISYWPANLDTVITILKEQLTPDTFTAVYPFFEWITVNIPSFVTITDPIIERG